MGPLSVSSFTAAKEVAKKAHSAPLATIAVVEQQWQLQRAEWL
jgi:hypothetical protein